MYFTSSPIRAVFWAVQLVRSHRAPWRTDQGGPAPYLASAKDGSVHNSYEFVRMTYPNPAPKPTRHWGLDKSYKITRVWSYEFVQISHLVKYIQICCNTSVCQCYITEICYKHGTSLDEVICGYLVSHLGLVGDPIV